MRISDWSSDVCSSDLQQGECCVRFPNGLISMTNKTSVPQAPKRRLSWNDPGFRALIYQVLILGIVGLGVWYLVSNTLHNLAIRNISTGFDFLHREAGFAIGERSADNTSELQSLMSIS